MKKLKEIKEMIDEAQRELDEIDDLYVLFPMSRSIISDRKEILKNHLEDIRGSIEALLLYSHCSILSRVCKNFLEEIFKISECLRVTYLVPQYSESYYIMDTIKSVEIRSNH